MSDREQNPMPPAQEQLFDSRLIGAAAVFCAGLLLAEVNVLASRHYMRIDVSDGARYTLSSATAQVVSQLDEPVSVTVLLGQGDPLLFEVRQILTAYRALSPKIHVKYVDPDRDTAEFLKLSKLHDIGTESNPNGGLVADAALLLKRGARTWFIRGAQLSEVDEDGNAQLRIEARLTEGIAQVQETEKSRICFVTGHGELSIDDSAPEGLIELRRRLERGNVNAERVPLDVPDPAAALRDCQTVAIIGPERRWPEPHVTLLRNHLAKGANVAIFLDPIVDDEGKIAASGLDSALKEVGVTSAPAFVLETDPASRLPSGLGEAFFAHPKVHATTSALSTDQARLDSRVVVVAASPLAQYPGRATTVVLETSAAGVTISDLNNPEARTELGEPVPVAIVSEVPKTNDLARRRSVVVGASNIVTNATFRDPALHGSRTFSESLFSWLLDRPTLVTVPERPPVQAGLSLTEASLSELLRYVLIYMPGAAACMGGFVLLRRRRQENRSHPGGEDLS